MEKLRRAFVRHDGALTVSLLCGAVYLGITFIFFGLMSINNWPLRNISRTSATTLLTWCIMLFAMHAVYGGYEVGKKKSKPIIYNMSLGSWFADLVTYVQLQIMNTNQNNNEVLELFGVDLYWLILAMILQLLLVMSMARLGNLLYFKINRPKKCLLIIGHPNEQKLLEKKIGSFKLQWQLSEIVLWNTPFMSDYIQRADVVFFGDLPDDKRMPLMKMCYDHHRDVLSRVNLQEIMLSGAQQVIIDDVPFLEMDYHKMTNSQRLEKRVMDVVISAVALLVLSPVLLLVAAMIRLEDGGPALFLQKRMTMGGREFKIIKFRTMRVGAETEKQISAEEDDPRITRMGRVLRKIRLDEIPQLINILRGDMSLVGPRPEMLENVEKYKLRLPSFVYREKMKAGLTGYAQIEGRYNTRPEDKLMLDLMYIEHFSIWEDVKLLLRTLTVFFKKDSTAGFAKGEQTKGEKPGVHG